MQKVLKILHLTDTHYCAENADVLTRRYQDLQKESFDIIIHTGDMANLNQDELEAGLRLLRTSFPNHPIYFTLGNHDLWNCSDKEYNDFVFNQHAKINTLQIGEMHRNHEELFKELNIIHMNAKVVDLNDKVVLMGLDGWYNNLMPPTKDRFFMPKMVEGAATFIYLQNQAEKQFVKLMNTDTTGKKVIFMTHFPWFADQEQYLSMAGNPSWGTPITDKAQLIFLGHSHQVVDEIMNSARVVNSGRTDKEPGYKIIEFKY